MAVADLTNEPVLYDDGKDSIVIVDNFQSVRGGKTLDVTGFTPPFIRAGHVIIQQTSNGQYKPMPVNSGATAYAALPSGHTYAGVLINTIRTSKPFSGIMVRGTINPAAAPFDFATVAAAFKTAMPLIDQRRD